METTYLILDRSPTIAPDFDDAKGYLNDHIISKIWRGKKKDQVSICTVHDTETNNPMNLRSPSEWLNCNLQAPELYSWDSLAALQQNQFACVNDDDVAEEETDLPRALATVLQKILDNQGKRKRAPSARTSVILVSNMLCSCSWEGLVEPVAKLAASQDVLVGAVYFEGDHCKGPEFDASVQGFKDLMALLHEYGEENGRCRKSFFAPYSEAKKYLRDWRYEPARYVQPTSVFKGSIRLCCDLDSIDIKNAVADIQANSEDLKEFLPEYDEKKDGISIQFAVDGYPITKNEVLTMSSEVGVDDDGEPFPLKYVHEHFVYEGKKKKNDDSTDDEEEEPETKQVQSTEIQSAYKYGSSIIPATTTINNLLNMTTYAGIDILYFVKKADIPPWYYRGESVLLIPTKVSHDSDLVALNSLVQSLLASKTIAIARVVQKPKRPIVLAALVPKVLVTNNTKNHSVEDKKRTLREMEEGDGSRQYYALSLVKLFFKDDEKIPVMPEFETPTDAPTDEMVDLMDQFVDELDLDRLNGVEHNAAAPPEDTFVEMNQVDTLPVPLSTGLGFKSTDPTFNEVTRKLLSLNSPRLHYLPKVIKAIYHYFLNEADTGESLYSLAQNASKTAATKDGKTFFDIFFDELASEVQKDGVNTFRPQVYDPSELSSGFATVVEKMEKEFGVTKREVEVTKSKADDEEAEDEEQFMTAEQLLA